MQSGSLEYSIENRAKSLLSVYEAVQHNLPSLHFTTETVLVEWYCFWDVTIWSQLGRLFSHHYKRAIERVWIGQCIVFAGRRITGAANSAELILEAVRWKTVLHSVYHRAAQTQNWKWNQEVGWVPEAPFDFKCKVHSPQNYFFTHPHSVFLSIWLYFV